jgi:hypothetical protein
MTSVVYTWCVCLLPFALVAEDQQPSRGSILSGMVKTVPDDLCNIVSYPFENPGETAVFLAVVGSLVLFDKPITRFYQDHVEPALDGFSLPDSPLAKTQDPVNGGEYGDDGWPLCIYGGTYLGGLLLNDAKAQKTGLLAAKAAGYSLVVSQLFLKSVTGRNRPVPSLSNDEPTDPYTDDPYDFGHFHGPVLRSTSEGTSMPSYHFTMAFAIAKVYQRAYDTYWLPYSCAAIFLASNIRGHHHWVSDMVAGSLIGTMIGDQVCDSWFDDSTLLEPVIGPDDVGLRLTLRF